MLNKNDLLDSLLREVEVVRHLVDKVPAGGWDHKPTENQRSTLEVARYLSFCGVGACYALVDGNWDRYKAWSEQTENLTPEEIPAALDRQRDALKKEFAAISDDDFANKKVTHPLGTEMTLGQGILDMSVKWMTGYRMQLFLYAKSAGNADLGTFNCWVGQDAPVTK